MESRLRNTNDIQLFSKNKNKNKNGKKMNSNLESHGHGKRTSKRRQGGGFDGGDWRERVQTVSAGRKREKDSGLLRKERKGGRFSDGDGDVGGCSAVLRSCIRDGSEKERGF